MLTEANALDQFNQAAASLPPYPGKFEGRGIVIAGGGVKYFPSAWVCIHMLREHGCSLPIQLWHLGPEEMTEQMCQLVQPVGVECVDALQVMRERPVPRLDGWQLKPYSILHCRFREVLFLDADNFPLVDPIFLFMTPQYGEHGAIFWPDYGRLGADQSIWRLTGVPFRDEPEFETGQIVVDKERCWQALALAMWMNDHGDFWYQHLYGDKDTFHLAWRKLDRRHAMPPYEVVNLPWVMCQHDFTGRRIFQHRNGAKWTLTGNNPKIAGFVGEDRGFAHLEELRKGWRAPAAALNSATLSVDIESGLGQFRAGHLHEAEAIAREILRRSPGDAAAIHLLGMIAIKTGHHQDALNLLRLSTALAPASADFHNNFAAVLGQLERHEEAMAAARRALELRPDLTDAHNNLGVALERLERFDEAVVAYKAAVKFTPSYGPGYIHLGNALRSLGRYEEAVEACRTATQLLPNSADAHNGLGVALLEAGKVNEALPMFRRAIRLQPDHVDAHVNRGMGLLLSGDLKAGWPEYEWRRRRSDPLWQRFATPSWYGSDLSGRTIFLYAEGGLGNAIQFARFVSFLAAQGARVLLECQPPLKQLLNALKGVAGIIGRGEKLPPYDEHAPLTSVPAVLGMSQGEIPADVPYLSADPGLVSEWQARLNQGPSLKVGINWLGEQNTGYGRYRSIPLRCFELLARVPRVQLISLRKSPVEPANFELTWLSGLDERGGAFTDTAAVMMSLDVIVTCDTATAHLGGALGRPTWVILPTSPDWRWMRDREDSPWYPTVRLFRQRESANWDEVFDQIADQLVDYPLRNSHSLGAEDVPA